jgi:hypothetical protein
VRVLAICTGQRPWRAGWGELPVGGWQEVAGEDEAGVGAWLLPALEAGRGQEWTVPHAIAVERGPGAFASLRSGIALALGLAAGWGCPVWPLSTLEGLAAAVPAGVSPVAVLVPGPPPLLALQRWCPGAHPAPLGRARWLAGSRLGAALREGDRACGPRRELWRAQLPPGVCTLGRRYDEVRPRVLAVRARERWRGRRPRAGDFDPLYLRPPS